MIDPLAPNIFLPRMGLLPSNSLELVLEAIHFVNDDFLSRMTRFARLALNLRVMHANELRLHKSLHIEQNQARERTVEKLFLFGKD